MGRWSSKAGSSERSTIPNKVAISHTTFLTASHVPVALSPRACVNSDVPFDDCRSRIGGERAAMAENPPSLLASASFKPQFALERLGYDTWHACCHWSV